MKILLTGADGQLGRALTAACPRDAQLVAAGRKKLDITDVYSCERFVEDLRPDWIVNAAGYTDVEEAEYANDQASSVNDASVFRLANIARKVGARLVHFSTDYVFDGSLRRPYRPDDQTCPINFYGRTKLGGEQAALSVLGEKALVIRTSWLYSDQGKNFLTTILRLLREREELQVVNDQFGSPTSVYSLAPVVFSAISRGIGGIHHWCDEGAVSWYDFARGIQRQALELGLTYRRRNISPVSTANYKTSARRPLWSVLDCSALSMALKLKQTDWQTCLKFTMQKMRG